MYQSNTFQDIPIAQYESLLEGFLGFHDHQGGPIWPQWDERRFERHMRYDSPCDAQPSLGTCERTLDIKNAFWAGPICHHYGHQIADFSMRIIPTLATNPSANLLFGTYKGMVPSWFEQIYRWFELSNDRITILNENCIIRSLSVCEQAEQIGFIGPTETHLAIMDEFIQSKKNNYETINQPIYVSRAGLSTVQSCIAGEKYIEHCINEAGGLVFRPEMHSLEDQLKVYLNASELIFAEGSALHTLQLLGHIKASIDIICRRSSESCLGPVFLINRAEKCNVINLVKHVIMGETLTGEPSVGSSVTIIDIDLLFDYFLKKGLNLAPHWNMRAYADCAGDDILHWVRSNTGNPAFHSIASDKKIIQNLQEAGLTSIANIIALNH